ncbi:MAG TPA: tetratricopeptide repeat protein [Solirubrobacteraceae bacterium]
MVLNLERERAALDWYEERRDELFSTVAQAHSREDDGQVLELASALAPFLARRSYWDEGETILTWGVEAARRSEHQQPLAEMLNELGTVHRQQSRFEQAAGEFELAFAIFGDIGDRPGEARALSNLGLTYRKLGQTDRARDVFVASIERWRQLEGSKEREHGLARSLNNLGMTLRDSGHYADAQALFEQALGLREQIEDADGVSRTLNNLGQLARLQENPAEASDLHLRALEIRRALGDRHGVARTAGSLALALAEQARLEEARALLEEAMSIRGALGDRYGEAETALQLARVEQAQGDPGAAVEQALFTAGLARELGVPRLAGEALVVQGEAHAALAEPDAAAAAWTAALEQFRALGADADSESMLRRLAE